MPDIKDYDYQRPPNMPEGVAMQQWFFPSQKKREFLPSRAPWSDGPAMVCSYDKDIKNNIGNLLATENGL